MTDIGPMFPDLDELKSDGWKDIGFLEDLPTGTFAEGLISSKSAPWIQDLADAATAYVTDAVSTITGVTYSDVAKEIDSIKKLSHWGGVSPEPRVAKPHECPHCFRQTHPEPLTQTQAQMYDSHSFNADYDVSADESPVVCIGADYQGPVTASTGYLSGYNSGGYYFPSYSLYSGPSWKQLGPPLGMSEWTIKWDESNPSLTTATWVPIGQPEKQPTDCEKLPIKFSDPDNWKPWEPAPKEWYPVDPGLDIKWEQWHTSFPTPDSPGYDFSAFKTPETSGPKKGKQK